MELLFVADFGSHNGMTLETLSLLLNEVVFEIILGDALINIFSMSTG